MMSMKTAWKVTVAVLAALLVLLLIAEFGLRAYIADQIRSDFAAEAPDAAAADAADVSFGASPVTFGLLRGALPHVEMTTPSTLSINGDTYSGQPGATINADNLRVVDGRQVADSVRITTELPEDYVRAILQQQLADGFRQSGGGPLSFLQELITVTGVTSHPDAGTFTIDVSGGAAAVDLRPMMNNGQLAFEASSTELFGFQLPDTVAEALTGALQQGVQDTLNGEMQVESFDVVDGGLRVTVAGRDVDLDNLSQSGAAG